jgi:hypothetical protein
MPKAQSVAAWVVFFFRSNLPWHFLQGWTMPDLDNIRAEIERMRVQVSRQRKEILQLQRAGINSLPAEALLARMLANIDNLCAERDKLKKERAPTKGRVLGGRSWAWWLNLFNGTTTTPTILHGLRPWPKCKTTRGYCQSGQIMSASALLASNPHPTDSDIDDAMSGNICRCGTYVRIREAIKQAAQSSGQGGWLWSSITSLPEPPPGSIDTRGPSLPAQVSAGRCSRGCGPFAEPELAVRQ